MTAIFLFDIDMTLIRSQGVGSSAMNTVMLELLGVADACAGVDFGGRTDRAILRDALTNHNQLPVDFELFLTTFEQAYVPVLQMRLREIGGSVLPGVHETLTAVQMLPDARVGVATGNFRRAAQAKLEHFNLHRYFRAGGYADDAEDRAELVRIAISRLAPERSARDRVVVIGDTQHDITAALANGAIAVGVATGFTSAAQLAAAGATHVLADLSEAPSLVRVLGH